MKRDVIVIGAGIGGTTAAALLQKAGLQTLLLDKNPRIGGSCSWYEKRGFHVDYGTHMFSRGAKGPLGQALRSVGAAVEFRQTPNLSELRGPGISLVVPSAAWKLPLFCLEAVRQLRIPMRELPHISRMFADIFLMSPQKIEAWDERSIDEFISGYTDDPRLFGLLGFLLGLYFILPPWECSAGESIYCLQNMLRDNALSYPKGGAAAIPRAFVAALRRYGGECWTRARVESLTRSGDGWRVTLRDGRELHAKTVVSTSSLPDLVDWIGPGKLPAAYGAVAAGVRKSYIAVQCKIALPRRRETTGCLVGAYTPDPSFNPWTISLDDYRTQFEHLDAGRVPPVVPIYCPIPTNFDASLGPPGTQLLTACAVAPTTDIARPEDKHPTRRNDKRFKEALLAAMETLVPGCTKEALFVDVMSTEGIASWIGKKHGPAVSTGQTPHQSGRNRPSVRSGLAGLYVAGDAAGGRGVGTELACESAIECAAAILADRRAAAAPSLEQLRRTAAPIAAVTA